MSNVTSKTYNLFQRKQSQIVTWEGYVCIACASTGHCTKCQNMCTYNLNNRTTHKFSNDHIQNYPTGKFKSIKCNQTYSPILTVQESLDSMTERKPQDLYINRGHLQHIFDRHCNKDIHTETSKLHPQLQEPLSLLNFIEDQFAHVPPIEIRTPKLTCQRKVFEKRFEYSVGTEGELSLKCVLDFHHNSNKILLATCYPVGPPIFPQPLTPLKTLLGIA